MFKDYDEQVLGVKFLVTEFHRSCLDSESFLGFLIIDSALPTTTTHFGQVGKISIPLSLRLSTLLTRGKCTTQSLFRS